MKVLILTHLAPFPQNGGYPIVVGNTIRGLVNSGHDVSLISINSHKRVGHPPATDELLSKITYKSFDIDTSVTALKAFLTLINPNSSSVHRYYNQAFERMLINEVKANKFDVIQFEGLFVTLYLPAIRKNCNAKLIYRAHNIEHQIWERLAHQKSDPFKKLYLQLSSKRIKRFELKQLNDFNAIAVFTAQDKQIMHYYGATVPVEVIPVGIEMNMYHPQPEKAEFPSLFFLGSLAWMPNREGIQWFLETFFNDISNGDLRVKVYIAGNDIPDQFDEYTSPGKIFIQGEVDDALEFVNSKAIMIVPLLSGGGMRVKIVEGMAMQKCIISTSLGAEGIPYTDGVNILIADNKEAFFNAITTCIADEDYCKSIGKNARRLIEENHDNGTITNRLIEFYEQILARKAETVV